jgi:DNA gyrase/topoisomerase IV subunit B
LDSACSGLENNRCKESQGLFPIRGKIINALTTPTKQFFENNEVSSLFKIMGYSGYQSKFDPDKFKPSKVIIATDADADGRHIECLLLSMFLKYLPFTLTGDSKIYVANPPLYGIQIGKKMKFFADNIEYVEYVRDIFCKDNEILDINKKKLTKGEIVKILYRNMDYLKYLNHISNTFAIDVKFLEFLLYNKDLAFSKFKTTVEKAYPFTTVAKENGIIMIHGLVGSLYQTVFFNDMLLNECRLILDLISRSDKYYYINGKKSTLYDLMFIFSKCEPSGITRYKGLGELEPKLLGESTIIPGLGRTLKQYTADDVKKELKYITSLQSDKSVFVKDIKVRIEDII